MLRKIEYQGSFPSFEGNIPFSLIEIQVQETNGEEVPDLEKWYTAYLDVSSEYKEIVGYETTTIIDEEGNEVEVETPIYETKETDFDAFSAPATWDEIQNVLYFDFKIGDRLYTFNNTPGATKVGLQNSVICKTVYEPITIDYDGGNGVVAIKQSNIKHLVPPTVPPLMIINGAFVVTGGGNEFIDEATNEQMTLEDIELYRNGEYIKNYRSDLNVIEW